MIFEILAAILAIVAILKFVLDKKNPEINETNVQNIPMKKKIPGMNPSDPEEGNRGDIKQMGTLSTFIINLHKKYGPVASFWEGKQMAVSIATPEMFKDVRHLFNVPTYPFEQFKILTGKDALSFSEEHEVIRRRKIYDEYFMLKACKTHAKYFIEIAEETTLKWMAMEPQEQINLFKCMSRLSIMALARTSFGNYFENEDNMTRFHELMDEVFRNMDPAPEPNSEQYNTLTENCNKINGMIKEIMEARKKEKQKDDRRLLIDILLEEDFTESERMADATVFMGAGYAATAIVITWCIYQLGRNPDIQEKTYQSIIETIGEQAVSMDDVPKLTHLRRVIDETLRWALRSSFNMRIAAEDMKIQGYNIAKGTTIYSATGIVSTDPKIWPDPLKFDPDRFLPENMKGRSSYAFKPFGFAGKRTCIGMSFAYSEITIYLAEWLRRFRFRLVSDKEVKPAEVLFSFPEEDIFVRLERR